MKTKRFSKNALVVTFALGLFGFQAQALAGGLSENDSTAISQRNYDRMTQILAATNKQMVEDSEIFIVAGDGPNSETVVLLKKEAGATEFRFSILPPITKAHSAGEVVVDFDVTTQTIHYRHSDFVGWEHLVLQFDQVGGTDRVVGVNIYKSISTIRDGKVVVVIYNQGPNLGTLKVKPVVAPPAKVLQPI